MCLDVRFFYFWYLCIKSLQKVVVLSQVMLETYGGWEHMAALIQAKKLRTVWLSPDRGPFAPTQHLNKRTVEQRRNLKEEQRKLSFRDRTEFATRRV